MLATVSRLVLRAKLLVPYRAIKITFSSASRAVVPTSLSTEISRNSVKSSVVQRSSSERSSLFDSLTEPRWDEPWLEHFILHEWRYVGDNFLRVRARWLRKMRRELEFRWPKDKPAIDEKWYKKKDRGMKLLIFIGHLGKEGKLDAPEMQGLRDAALQRLVEEGFITTAGPIPKFTIEHNDACFNCGAIGHWKAECPETLHLKSTRRSIPLSGAEKALIESRLARVDRIKLKPRKTHEVLDDDHTAWRGLDYGDSPHLELSSNDKADGRVGQHLPGPSKESDGRLLTGHRPRMIRSRGRVEMQHAIDERQPLKYEREVGDNAEIDPKTLARIEKLVEKRSVLRAQGHLEGTECNTATFAIELSGPGSNKCFRGQAC